MNTIVWLVDNNVDKLLTCPQLIQAAELLIKNEVVAFPTETVYGLGGNASIDEAVNKIFAAKGRPSDNPLIVHIGETSQLTEFVQHVPETAQKLIDAFWPGPLTIIFTRKEGTLSDKVTAGLSTVAMRMPDHPVALALLKMAKLPIAAPSANRSGKPSPTIAKHVFEDLNGRIAGIVDGGATGVGVESTVIDCTGEVPMILRPGGITKEEIEAVVGKVELDQALVDEKTAPKSPGMKYTHYAPNAPLSLVEGSQLFIQQLVDIQVKQGFKVGVLTTEERTSTYRADSIVSCGKRTEPETVAQHLYEALRSFDETGVDIIYAETFSTEGIGQAIMNRLLKAAGHRVIYENREERE